MDYPWSEYRCSWVKLWPILPGLPAGVFFHSSQFAESFVAGMMTLGLVILLTSLGTKGRRVLIMANGLALILAAMVSFVAYQLFRFLTFLRGSAHERPFVEIRATRSRTR